MSPQISIRDTDADEDHLFYQAIVMSDRWYDAADDEHFAYHFVEDGLFGNMTIEEEIFQEWDADGQDWLETTEFGVEIEPITIELETYVGAELEVWGYLNSEAFSDGQGWAAADNLNSLASELRPAEGFESVSLDYALVPEPTSGALLLLGLAAVAARRRGRG